MQLIRITVTLLACLILCRQKKQSHYMVYGHIFHPINPLINPVGLFSVNFALFILGNNLFKNDYSIKRVIYSALTTFNYLP